MKTRLMSLILLILFSYCQGILSETPSAEKEAVDVVLEYYKVYRERNDGKYDYWIVSKDQDITWSKGYVAWKKNVSESEVVAVFGNNIVIIPCKKVIRDGRIISDE